MVPEEGLEPSRPCGHGILSPARLPVPPLRLPGKCPDFPYTPVPAPFPPPRPALPRLHPDPVPLPENPPMPRFFPCERQGTTSYNGRHESRRCCPRSPLPVVRGGGAPPRPRPTALLHRGDRGRSPAGDPVLPRGAEDTGALLPALRGGRL